LIHLRRIAENINSKTNDPEIRDLAGEIINGI
jgi:hypothetical protein